MLLILDSNEYIFALGQGLKTDCANLLQKILIQPEIITIRVCRLIVDEVRGKLPPEAFKEFITLINRIMIIDEDFIVPFSIVFKYETMGLKPADAFIAAYTEWIGADVLISENRHFITRQKGLPFKILTAEKCLKLI